MSKRITQEEWDKRGAARNIKWLEPVAKGRAKTKACCTTCGYEWSTTAHEHGRCPVCAGSIVSQQTWDDRAEAVGLTWLETVKAAKSKTLCRCETCKYEWRVIPNNVQNGQGCPNCAGQLVSEEQWNERAAAVGIEWTGPAEPNRNNRPARCLTCGYEFSPPRGHVQQGTGCPRCAGHIATDEDWAERAKALNIEWLEPVVRARQRARAKCLVCDNEWLAMPDSVQAGQGCRLCGWKRTGEKVRLPQEEWDRRAKELNIEWLEPLTGARTAKAKCLKCSYEWSPHKIVIARGGACPMCAGSIVTQDQWDERAHAVDLEWLEPVKSADTQTLAKCLKCGYAWKTSPNRVQQGGGCASCSASGGFNPAKPAFLYLMVKPDGVAQVGITGEGRAMKMRMQKHQRNGYELVTTWHFNDGADARNIEQAIINQWRTEDDLLPAAPEGEESWTETVHTDSLPLPEIVKRINALVAAKR